MSLEPLGHLALCIFWRLMAAVAVWPLIAMVVIGWADGLPRSVRGSSGAGDPAGRVTGQVLRDVWPLQRSESISGEAGRPSVGPVRAVRPIVESDRTAQINAAPRQEPAPRRAPPVSARSPNPGVPTRS